MSIAKDLNNLLKHYDLVWSKRVAKRRAKAHAARKARKLQRRKRR